MIRALRLGNFKALGKTQDIPLKPITLIFGPNSAGKSSIIHSLALVHEASRSGKLDISRTTLGGDSIDLGGFAQYVFKGNLSENVELGMDFDISEENEGLARLLGSAKTLQVIIKIGTQCRSQNEQESGTSKPTLRSFSVLVDGIDLFQVCREATGGFEFHNINSNHPAFKTLIRKTVKGVLLEESVCDQLYTQVPELLEKLLMKLKVSDSAFLLGRVMNPDQDRATMEWEKHLSESQFLRTRLDQLLVDKDVVGSTSDEDFSRTRVELQELVEQQGRIRSEIIRLEEVRVNAIEKTRMHEERLAEIRKDLDKFNDVEVREIEKAKGELATKKPEREPGDTARSQELSKETEKRVQDIKKRQIELERMLDKAEGDLKRRRAEVHDVDMKLKMENEAQERIQDLLFKQKRAIDIRSKEEERLNAEIAKTKSRIEHARELELPRILGYLLPKSIDDVFRAINEVIQKELHRLEYLGPLRSYPPRGFEFTESNDTNWRAGGGYAWDVVRKNPKVRASINEWLGAPERLKTPYRIEIQHLLPPSRVRSSARNLMESWLKAFEETRAGKVGGKETGHEERWQEISSLLSKITDSWANTLAETGESKTGISFEKDEGRSPSVSGDLWKSVAGALSKEWSDEKSSSQSRWTDVSKAAMAERPSDIVEIKLIDLRTNTRVSHRDVGIGVSQVLPVLVSAYGSRDRIVAVEQPEIHLHPALQAELGDVFIEAALGERKNTFLIETHSEHLILRLLRRIRETTDGELPQGIMPVNPDDIAVLYAQPGEHGTEVIHIPVTADGEFDRPWPDGFFAERAAELF